jgi:hypothetical protein
VIFIEIKRKRRKDRRLLFPKRKKIVMMMDLKRAILFPSNKESIKFIKIFFQLKVIRIIEKYKKSFLKRILQAYQKASFG